MKHREIKINEKNYSVELIKSKYVKSEIVVGFCNELAKDFLPVLFDSIEKNGTIPFPPDAAYYRIFFEPTNNYKICILYEIYWKDQKCSGKDHKHDYEQIQIHINTKNDTIEKIILSAKGSPALSFHGIHVFQPICHMKWYGQYYRTASKVHFPWGGSKGQSNVSELFEMPLIHMNFFSLRPSVYVSTCYHAFEGISSIAYEKEKSFLDSNKIPLKTKKLNDKILDIWYHYNVENRFGHDISNPFESPFIKYFPPPDHSGSRFWILLKRIFARFWSLL